MLNFLSVRQFAVVEKLDVDFDHGLSVLTGETGAGKSLLVDALMLIAGGRGDTSFIRDGAKRAEIHTEFDIGDIPQARQWLEDQALDDEDNPHVCQLRRIIAQDGRSRAWINGRPVSISQLAKLAPTLIEIHGQHEHQTLLSRSHQLTIIDAFAEHTDLLQQLAHITQAWQDAGRQLHKLQGGDDHGAQISLIQHELEQLERWALPAEAFKQLVNEHKRLANAEELIGSCQNLANLLGSDEPQSLMELLSHAQTMLDNMVNLDQQLETIQELVSNAQIQLQEAGNSVDHYVQDLDADPARFSGLDTQLAHIYELARRHQVGSHELDQVRQQHQLQLENLENATATIERLTDKRKQLVKEYQTKAQLLHVSRQEAAVCLADKVTALMQDLGMQGGKFAVELTHTDSSQLSARGWDRIEFMVSANRGQTPQALRKVASGGELARISLAIKVATLAFDNQATMVFDEVDTGIGGAIAEVVGQKLRILGQSRQVLCVTHLPQVAAQGHQHIKLSKHTAKAVTVSQAQRLDYEARIGEIARMLGGIKMTQETLAHAQQMLDLGQQSRPQEST